MWLPAIGGVNLLFLILVSLGVGVLLRCFYDQNFRSLALLVYFAFGLLSLSNSVLYQKYFDFPAMLVCCLGFYNLRETRTVHIILLVYCVGFAGTPSASHFRRRVGSKRSDGELWNSLASILATHRS